MLDCCHDLDDHYCRGGCGTWHDGSTTCTDRCCPRPCQCEPAEWT